VEPPVGYRMKPRSIFWESHIGRAPLPHRGKQAAIGEPDFSQRNPTSRQLTIPVRLSAKSSVGGRATGGCDLTIRRGPSGECVCRTPRKKPAALSLLSTLTSVALPTAASLYAIISAWGKASAGELRALRSDSSNAEPIATGRNVELYFSPDQGLCRIGESQWWWQTQ
jgi:hypothetical protein